MFPNVKRPILTNPPSLFLDDEPDDWTQMRFGRNIYDSSSTEIIRDNQKLEMVRGQRGKMLLLVDGYTLPQNNVAGNTTYWCCRSRPKGTIPCNARATTTLKPNGLYKLVITKPKHNHSPTGGRRKVADKTWHRWSDTHEMEDDLVVDQEIKLRFSSVN